MKIALVQFNSTFLRPVLLKIIQELKVTEIHSFWPLPIDHGIEDQLPKDLIIHEHWKDWLAIMANDGEAIDFNQLLPLDAEILTKMAPYEHMCKRTLQRNVKYWPRLFNPDQNGILQLIDRWLNHIGYKYNSYNPSYNELHEYYLRAVRFWNDLLYKNEIDIFLSEFLPHAGMDNVGYAVSKSRDIPTVFGYFTPATTFQYWMTDYERPAEYLYQIIEDLKIKYQPEELQFRPGTIQELARVSAPPEKQAIPFVGDFKKQENIAKKAKKFKDIAVQKAKSGYLQFSKPLSSLTNIFDRSASLLIKSPIGKRYGFQQRREAFYNKYQSQPDYEESFIYLPLHLQPEASSQPIGGWFELQLLIVEQLHYYLPSGWKIYVKEHRKFSDHNYRPLQFYKNLIRMENVRLVPREESTFDLLENCRAVAAVTSTAGWEGLFKNKPFLMFGYHLTQYAPGVIPIRNNQDCKAAIEKVVQGISINRDELKYFAKALEMISVPTTSSRFQYMQKECSEEEWIEMLANGYINQISKVLNIENAIVE